MAYRRRLATEHRARALLEIALNPALDLGLGQTSRSEQSSQHRLERPGEAHAREPVPLREVCRSVDFPQPAGPARARIMQMSDRHGTREPAEIPVSHDQLLPLTMSEIAENDIVYFLAISEYDEPELLILTTSSTALSVRTDMPLRLPRLLVP
ncbi:MAG: hypothetical protein PGN33_14245 [Methylobacterium radiotolerans]